MASLLQRLSNLITKNAQQTAASYNKAIYQYLGESIIWNPENDDSYIQQGYEGTQQSIHLSISLQKRQQPFRFKCTKKQAKTI